MGSVNGYTSDISGRDMPPSDTVHLIIRQHPDLEGPKIIDLHRLEAARLPGFRDDVALELKLPSGEVVRITCTATEFDQIVTPEVLEDADDYTRGRRKTRN